MKGYWIVKANTVNAEKQKDYASLASKAVEKYGGKVVHNSGPDDYIHPSILDVVDHMVEGDPVWVMINSF